MLSAGITADDESGRLPSPIFSTCSGRSSKPPAYVPEAPPFWTADAKPPVDASLETPPQFILAEVAEISGQAPWIVQGIGSLSDPVWRVVFYVSGLSSWLPLYVMFVVWQHPAGSRGLQAPAPDVTR